MDLRDDQWERRIFKILKFAIGTNSGGLAIFGRRGQQHIMYQGKKVRVFQLRTKVDFPINACKIEKLMR